MRAVLLCLLGLWPALSFANLSADMVIVKKSTYSLTLMKDGKEVKRYWIALARRPRGTSSRKGISVRRKGATPSTTRRPIPATTKPSISTTRTLMTSSEQMSWVYVRVA